jgi:thymidylate synthase (FAD)
MPSSKDIPKIELPMKLRFGEKPITEFKNIVDSIEIKTLIAPPANIKRQLYDFMMATWSDSPVHNPTDEEVQNQFELLLQGKALPAALECIQFTFLINGITIQEVTHILRHRLATFSAQCSGDLWWSHHDALVPTSIQNNKKFNDRYEKLVIDAKQLYCDMIDSKEISIMDSRYILPRCLSTFYYMRMSLNDILAFIKQRKCTQIQPATDNKMAELLLEEVSKIFPEIKKYVSLKCDASCHYVKTANTGKATNLYIPDKAHDIFDYNPENFIYQKTRKEMGESYNLQDE